VAFLRFGYGMAARRWFFGPLLNRSAPAALAIGTVSKGYRFKGGDPSQQSNSELVGVVTLNPASPDADYDKLPSGTRFIGPDGLIRVKR
jgi:hypothetical protein